MTNDRTDLADDPALRRRRDLAALHAMQNTRIRELLAELVIDRGGDRSARYAELRRWFAVREATANVLSGGSHRAPAAA
ncbi:hypothetical protein [Nocardia bovistercoris]|uniref:Uncharacterized protein n=1 Tax=Nocardia bovistercoris TaxID=2785916 RepID=A0A931N2H0_9NOCA|nr:hypothetical protein [Nocardia bovistercoris]MBH0779495.1 hypothetical protein [Nocardia bovistercoris]